jgi:hypothetical protein
LVLPTRSDGVALQTVTDANGTGLAIHGAVFDGTDYGMVTLAHLAGTAELAATYA